jgi:DNA-binding beta-propeller fold protein YncE
MRTRISRVFSALVASAALLAGLATSTAASAATSSAEPAATASPVAAACRAHHVIAYVAVFDSMGAGVNAVVPVDTVTGAVLKPVPVANGEPMAIVAAPDGKLVYAAAMAWPASSVVVISTRTDTVVKTIPVKGPQGMTTVIGITPNGKMLYVSFGTTVVPIRTADDKVFKPIPGGGSVAGFAFTADSKKLYVNSSYGGSVLPVSTVTNTAGTPIPAAANSLAMAPDGKTLYAAGGSTLTPVSTVTDKPGPAISLGEAVMGVAISPNGRTGYVSNFGSYAGPGKLFPVNLATGNVRAPIALPGVANWVVFGRHGKTVYAGEQQALVQNQVISMVSVIRAATKSVRAEVNLPAGLAGLVVTPDGRTVYALNTASLTPIRTATNRVGAAIPLPGVPIAVAFIWR